MKRLALSLIAVNALCASVAEAGSYPQVQGPTGAYISPQPVAGTGIDSVTGAACALGSAPTCLLPVPGGSIGAPGFVIVAQPTTPGDGTIATANAPQVLFGGATPVHGWKISIPSSSPGSAYCWASDSTATPSATSAGSYPIAYAGQYSTEPGQLPAGPVYLNCPAAQAFSAQRW